MSGSTHAISSPLRIVADADMPLVGTLFSRVGTVKRMPGRSIGRQVLQDADVLLVRSITRVDAAMVAGTPVRFVGSATIGMDHLDLAGLRSVGVHVVNAPGCNARAVAEYVVAAVFELCRRQDRDWRSLRIGVIGAGNVGGRVAALWRRLGLEVLVCDPPLQAQGVPGLLPLDSLRDADVMCFHVPLVREGPWRSVHLVDEAFLQRLRPDTWLLNAGRGEVFDNDAVLRRLARVAPPRLVLDVWEGEPRPLPALVTAADIATPHIAGHSIEGKLRGTWQVWEGFCDWTGWPLSGSFEDCLSGVATPEILLPTHGPQAIQDIIRQVFPIHEDDRLLKQSCGVGAQSDGFDHLRRGYRHRREFPAARWQQPERLASWPESDRAVLATLGFHPGEPVPCVLA